MCVKLLQLPKKAEQPSCAQGLHLKSLFKKTIIWCIYNEIKKKQGHNLQLDLVLKIFVEHKVCRQNTAIQTFCTCVRLQMYVCVQQRWACVNMPVTGDTNCFCKRRNEFDLVQTSTEHTRCQIHFLHVLTTCWLDGHVAASADRPISYSLNTVSTVCHTATFTPSTCRDVGRHMHVTSVVGVLNHSAAKYTLVFTLFYSVYRLL